MRRKQKATAAAAVVLIAAGLAGCAPRADVDALNNNQLTLREMVATDRQQIEALDQRTKRLQDQFDQLKQGGGAADSSEQMSKLDDRLGRVEAAVSALQAGASASAPNPVGASAAGTSANSAGGGLTSGISAGSPTASAMAATPKWQSEIDPALDDAAKSRDPASKVYKDGLAAMKDAKYPLAISKFALLQRKYPKSELSEPAEYFSANAFYEAGKYDQAILQFNDLVMRYPKGKYASSALLREAQAFVQLNDKIDARLTLQKLISDHGDSPEAGPANSMMKDLES